VHHRIIAVIAALSLGGCAQKSADIAPAYISPILYQSYTCPQLAEEAQRVSAAAVTATGAQDSQATKDAVATTVSVIVFWPALFLVGGDKQNAAQLAQLKGEMDAIEQASIQKNCGIQFRQAPPAGSAAPTAAAPPAPSTSPASSYAQTNQK
jgi:hypothetical protein